jgi:hypothetical protein
MSGRKLAYVGVTIGTVLLLLCIGAQATAANRPLKPPEVWSGKAIEVQGTYVVLQGWVDPRGQVTSFHYELGTTTSYGISPELSDEQRLWGYWSDEVLEAIPRLRHRTTYHFRLVAHSRAGTTYGKDKTFRTLGPAAP